MNDSTVQVTKRCSKCGNEKPATREFFYAAPTYKHGVTARCKVCLGEAQKLRPRRKTPRLTPEVFAARFWSKVNKSGPVPAHCPELGACWIWTAYRNPYGYGEVGRSNPRRVECSHRVAWELEQGPAGELCVLHKCDRPSCVRPEHLFLGTRTENMVDKVRKGRQHRGSRLPHGTAATIRELARSGLSHRKIAHRVGHGREAVALVLKGD